MKPWDFNHYKEFLRSWIHARPKNGRGELKKMAQYLGVHTTLLSHVINGEKNFGHEQLLELIHYLGLTPFETDYLFTLYARDCAGSYSLEKFYEKKLQALKEQALKVKNRLKVGKKLDLKEKQTFYSSYLYSAIRLLTAIPACQTLEGLIDKTQMDRSRVQEILDFLIETGLCVEKNGLFQYGPKSTHIPEEDPLVLNHHKNWRTQALVKMEDCRAKRDHLFFTMPVVLSKNDAIQVKKLMLECIERVTQLTDPSDCERLYVLNMDWFEF